MSLTLLLATLLALSPGVRAQAPRDAQMLNLSCVEALVSIGQASLAGVFSFIPEKDSPAAFADLIVHDRKALKKYAVKLEKDLKEAGGISVWDHEAVAFALSIYASPLAETLDKPGASLLTRLDEFARAQTMSLQDLTARRRR